MEISRQRLLWIRFFWIRFNQPWPLPRTTLTIWRWKAFRTIVWLSLTTNVLRTLFHKAPPLVCCRPSLTLWPMELLLPSAPMVDRWDWWVLRLTIKWMETNSPQWWTMDIKTTMIKKPNDTPLQLHSCMTGPSLRQLSRPYTRALFITSKPLLPPTPPTCFEWRFCPDFYPLRKNHNGPCRFFQAWKSFCEAGLN